MSDSGFSDVGTLIVLGLCVSLLLIATIFLKALDKGKAWFLRHAESGKVDQSGVDQNNGT